jgi:photosystem II stability/assembly factor-like uncharacterized protein
MRQCLGLLFLLLGMLLIVGCGTVAPSSDYTWTQIDSGTTNSLTAVCVIDETHAWAVGADSTILFYDGTSWEADPQSGTLLPDMHLNAIYAADQNHVWAVGDQVAIIFYDGVSWEIQSVDWGSDDDLFAITGTDESHVYAARMGGLFNQYDGANWSGWYQITAESGADLGYFCQDIAACGDKIWIAAADEDIGVNAGVVLYYNGAYWNIAEPQNLGQGLASIAAADANHVWVAGNRGGIFFSSGEAFAQQASGVESETELDIRSMHAVNQNEVWAVGDPGASGVGTILKFDGTRWNSYNCGVNEHFFGVSTYDGSKVWVVGDHGKIVLGTKVR